MLRRLIESLLILDSETSHILLKILHYIITIILPEDSLPLLAEDFLHLSVVLSKCRDSQVLLQILDLLKGFLQFNKKGFQRFLRETEVFSGILSRFLDFFKGGSDIVREELKCERLIEVLKLLLEGNEENLGIFQNFDLFLLMLYEKSNFFDPMVLFFLEEQAKAANLQPFLEVLWKGFIEGTDLEEKLRLSAKFFMLLEGKEDTKEIFRDALLKKYRFLNRYIDLVRVLVRKEEYLKGFLRRLKESLLKEEFLRKYFRKKNLFIGLFKGIKEGFFKERDIEIKHKRVIINLIEFSVIEDLKDASNEDFIDKILIFPEIISLLIEYIALECDLSLQKLILNHILSFVKGGKFNTNGLARYNLLEVLGICYNKEVKTSSHPFYEVLLEIIYKMIRKSPSYQDIKLIETILIGINQEVSPFSSFYYNKALK